MDNKEVLNIHAYNWYDAKNWLNINTVAEGLYDLLINVDPYTSNSGVLEFYLEKILNLNEDDSVFESWHALQEGSIFKEHFIAGAKKLIDSINLPANLEEIKEAQKLADQVFIESVRKSNTKNVDENLMANKTAYNDLVLSAEKNIFKEPNMEILAYKPIENFNCFRLKSLKEIIENQKNINGLKDFKSTLLKRIMENEAKLEQYPIGEKSKDYHFRHSYFNILIP